MGDAHEDDVPSDRKFYELIGLNDTDLQKIAKERSRHIVRHTLPAGELWRATDFWREGLGIRTKGWIYSFNKHNLPETHPAYQTLSKAKTEQKLPSNLFVSVKGWLWSVKEDGILVKLTRDRTRKWSMHTRPGNKLNPPETFLKGLEQNTELPDLMIGELVTCFTGCKPALRLDEGKRNISRNEAFAAICRIFKSKNPEVWNGLRVKIFSFPTSEMNIQNTYKHYENIMKQTMKHHPHIGMCKSGVLNSTAHAIDIFNSVVQMGLEGIVIVKGDVKYGEYEIDDYTGKQQRTDFFFKLKQKIVLPTTVLTKAGDIEIKKEGKKVQEHMYTITLNEETIRFRDQQDRKEKDGKIRSRIKYMERVPKCNRFPCIDGYRHMHFATDYDMTVRVPFKELLTQDTSVLEVLGVHTDRVHTHKNRILSWGKAEDRHLLGSQILLFNPRPFDYNESRGFNGKRTIYDVQGRAQDPKGKARDDRDGKGKAQDDSLGDPASDDSPASDASPKREIDEDEQFDGDGEDWYSAVPRSSAVPCSQDPIVISDSDDEDMPASSKPSAGGSAAASADSEDRARIPPYPESFKQVKQENLVKRLQEAWDAFYGGTPDPELPAGCPPFPEFWNTEEPFIRLMYKQAWVASHQSYHEELEKKQQAVTATPPTPNIYYIISGLSKM